MTRKSSAKAAESSKSPAKKREIAVLLHVSSRTVEFHKYRIMETLGIRTVAGLAAYAAKNRMIA